MTSTTNNLAIPYKGRSIGTTLAVAFGLLAGCGYFLALALFFGLGMSHVATLTANQVLLIFPVTLAMSFSTALYLLDNASIRLTPEGICLPPSFAFSMNWRCVRTWSDLAQISVSTNGSRLILHFKSGGFAGINTTRLNKEQIEQLALAIEIRAREAARKSPDLALLLECLHNEKRLSGNLSYTQIWEDEMNRHFSAVTFIPLEPERTLQDGRLKVLRQLSFGGFSAVYLAQTPAGDKVVIKESVIPNNQKTASWSDAEKMLEKEAHLLMQLSHPQIVKARDFFIENGKIYYKDYY